MSTNFDTVIMYLRKSREDVEREKQTGEDTLQAHRERLSELLRSKGINSWIERAEVKTGDTIAARPVFRRVLGEDIPAAAGKKMAICITEISRLGRGDMEDAGRIYKTIINYNIWLITPYKEYNPQNPADLRSIRFELFLSREEYEMIKDRLWQARDQKGKKGYAANYIVTLGYGQSRGKVFEIPEEARLVREIFELRAENKSYQEIADMLNARGLKTKRGTKYHQTTIGKILKNPRYVGRAKWRGQYYDSQGPSIVPLELWNRVHNDVPPARTVLRRTTKAESPYLVTLYCHECGHRMYGEWITLKRLLQSGCRADHEEYGVYVCIGRKKADPKCSHRQRIAYVHDLTLKELRSILDKREILDKLIEQRSKNLSADVSSIKERLLFKEREIKAKETFLEKCKKDYKNGDLAAPLYTDLYEETTKEIGILAGEAKSLKKRLNKAAIKIERPEILFSKLREVVDDWDNIPNASKKIIISSFLSRVSISKNGILHVARNLPLRLS